MRSKYVAAAAAVGLLVGVPAAGAAGVKMISGKEIKNGTVMKRDLSKGVQRKLDKAGQPGATGATGATGAVGATGPKGDRGPIGQPGADGTDGKNGTDGKDGRDAVRWERVVGNCVSPSNGAQGEVIVIDNALKLNLPNDHGAYGQFKMLVENVRLSDVNKLSFRVKLPVTTGSAYLKLKLEGNRFIVFQPGANGAETTEWTTYNVAAAGSKLRDNNDSGTTPTYSLAELQATHGNLAVKSLEITGGCAGSAINGAVLVDDVTLNDTVIDFN